MNTTSNSYGISLSVNGSNDSIRKLYEERQNYRVRVWFNNLRCRNNVVNDLAWVLDSVDADVVKIEIFDVR